MTGKDKTAGTANILQVIATHAKERVAAAKRDVPLSEMRRRAEQRYAQEQAAGAASEENGGAGVLPFEAALRAPGMRFICECKKASPSKGIIAEAYPYLQIAKEYDQAGAACLSVLTEPKWFLGQLSYLEEIAAAVSVPCLRKDFTVDPYMIYEAKAAGASAVLLIASILSEEEIEEDLAICRSVGLSALCEAHDAAEVECLAKVGARIIGVNNRDLRDFSVDFSNSLSLRQYAPAGTVFVAESGVKTAEDVRLLYDNGIRACLVGESLMRAPDKSAKLAELASLL